MVFIRGEGNGELQNHPLEITSRTTERRLKMKTRREIVKFLCDEFVDLACENCECKNTKYCAGCDLENCNWEISEKAADRIAGEILEE